MKVIIVHRNERSLKDSFESSAKQVGAENVYLISCPSFRESMLTSFNTALFYGWDWFVFMGGDQILLDSAVETLVSKSQEYDETIFRVSGSGYDKLLMIHRNMAPCLYNGNLMDEALKIKNIPEIQPEAYVSRQMKKKGYGFVKIIDALAIHDENQYLKDVYKKGYNEAGKFLNFIRNNGIMERLERAKGDDYRVFLEGINDYIKGMERDPEEVLKALNIKEKQ